MGLTNCVHLQVAQEMVFVWPESGPMAALEAANTKPVLSPYMTEQVLNMTTKALYPCLSLQLHPFFLLCPCFPGNIHCHHSL